MGMFKWLKRELRSGSRERSKSSLGFEQVNSPQSKINSNLNDLSRDEDYLRKLSKFNEWRSSQVGLRTDHGGKTPNERRVSQADFKLTPDHKKHMRYSLDNHHMQYKHLERNDAMFNTPPNKGNKNVENIYITDRSQTEPVNNRSKSDRRELARIDMTFNRSFNKSQRRKSRKDSVNKNLFDGRSPDADFERQENPDKLPQSFYEHENSLPFGFQNDDTYQWVVNKHGEVVEYALPYTERSVDITRRDLSDIIENESNSDACSAKDNDTYSITHSTDAEVVSTNTKPRIGDSGKSGHQTKNIVTRCGTANSNDKVAKRLSEVDVKSLTCSLEKKRNVHKKSVQHDKDKQPDDHNKEFLDAIEDLVSLGQWSKRQLESELAEDNINNKCKPKIFNGPITMSMIEPINPSSEFLNCPMVHISCLYVYDEPYLKHTDSILEWRKATWCKENVFIRSSKPELMHLYRTQTAMARDVHVLRNVPHKNIALLMALAYDDDNQVVTVMEPFSNTLYQLLHEQTYEVPWNLDKYTRLIHQICSALNFLHNRGFIHTNISSHCILIDFAISQAKLSGFELAVGIDRDYKQYYYPKCKNIENNLRNVEQKQNDQDMNSVSHFDDVPSINLGRHNRTNKEVRRKTQRKLNENECTVDCNKNFTILQSSDENLEEPKCRDAWDFCVWGEEQRLTDRIVLANYHWQAPELFDNFNTTVVRPCVGSDVYSLSLVLLECCSVSVPWKGISLQELALKYKNMQCVYVPDKVETAYADLIAKGTRLEPKNRILTISDFMQELEDIKADIVTGHDLTKKDNYGSHSRLRNILSRETLQNEQSTYIVEQETYNIDDCIDKTHESIEEKQSKIQKYYTELNANKVEYSEEDAKRMTCFDFLQQLDQETKKISPQKNTSNNMYSSPVMNFSNATDYYSINEKSNLDTKQHNLTNSMFSPDAENNVSSKSKFLLNITPKFYTPLQIQSPHSVADLSITNYHNGKSHDSVYSFDIDEFELPETPIARNTKIRKNAWLSEQKHENRYTESKKISHSFNGTYDIRRNPNKNKNNSDIVYRTKGLGDTSSKADDVYEEIGRLREDINKTFNKILEVDSVEKMYDPNAENKTVNQSQNQTISIENKVCISKNTPVVEDEFYTPEAKFTSTPESESVRAIRRRDRIIRINSVKTKLNDILTRSLNCGTNCLTSTPTRVEPHSMSFCYDTAHREKLQPSPVKPASHSRDSTFAVQNKKWSPRRFRLANYPNMSPPYNADAIKPASHHDECNTLPRDKHTSSDQISSTQPGIQENLEDCKNIELQAAIDHFENSLWKMEKSKCEMKRGDKQAIDKNLVNCSTQTPRNELKISENEPIDITFEKITTCSTECQTQPVIENFLRVYEKPTVDNFDGNITVNKDFGDLRHDVINVNCKIICDVDNVKKVSLSCESQNRNNVIDDKECQTVDEEQSNKVNTNLKIQDDDGDSLDKKNHSPKSNNGDCILTCAKEFNEKLFIDESKLNSDVIEEVKPEIESKTEEFSEIPNFQRQSNVNDSTYNMEPFNDSYFPLTDFSRYTTLPNKISTRIIVTPDRGFFSQICRKETSMSSNRRVSVLEIAKIFEKRSKDCVKNLRNEKLSVDSSLSRGRQFMLDKSIKDFEDCVNSNVKDFDEEGSSEAEFMKNVKNSEFPEFEKRFDQSFIYNNALEEGDHTDVKVCSHCGSHVDSKEKTPRTEDQRVEQTQTGTPRTQRRLTLGPELAEMCATLLRDQFLDLETRCLLSSAYDLAQNSNSLRRCQAFVAIQDARSIEDLYIDDEFTSEEQLGSHMQLSSCHENNTSSSSSIADGYDIYYRESDFHQAINLEEFPLLSIDLNRNDGDDGSSEIINEEEQYFIKDLANFRPCLTQIAEEQSDCDSCAGGAGEVNNVRRRFAAEEMMAVSSDEPDAAEENGL